MTRVVEVTSKVRTSVRDPEEGGKAKGVWKKQRSVERSWGMWRCQGSVERSWGVWRGQGSVQRSGECGEVRGVWRG